MSTLNLIIALSSPSIIQSAKVQYIPIKKERLRINKDRSRERERERRMDLENNSKNLQSQLINLQKFLLFCHLNSRKKFREKRIFNYSNFFKYPLEILNSNCCIAKRIIYANSGAKANF